jgi:hypothetical protein
MGALIIIPQIVVAGLAPWVGYYSEWFGRKPLLLVGLGAQAVRALALASFNSVPTYMLTQVLDGISGAIIGVLTLLVITDLTAGSGRFNLARGMVATLSGIAASVSTRIFDPAVRRFYRVHCDGGRGYGVSSGCPNALTRDQADQIYRLITGSSRPDRMLLSAKQRIMFFRLKPGS